MWYYHLFNLVPTYFHQKTVLVTGAAGFIGSHLCERLLAGGAQVLGVDNFLTGRKKNVEHLVKRYPDEFHLIEADAIQPPETYLPKNIELDAVFHFASPASPPRYQAYPVETYLINSLGTHHLLQYLKHNFPQAQLIFASTSEVYGDPEQHPQPESYWGNVNPNGIRSCYDEAKRLGETICGVHYRDFGLDIRLVRIFNTYGPRINPEDGRVIPQFFQEALQGIPYSIHGDGSQTRSYCYVDDLVEGILRFMTVPHLEGETINLGNPEEYTVLQTAKIIDQIVYGKGHQPEFKYFDLPQDDPTRRQPDIRKAKQLLNWTPSVPFTTGLTRTLEFFRTDHE